jgi:hypothetical protein
MAVPGLLDSGFRWHDEKMATLKNASGQEKRLPASFVRLTFPLTT